MNKKAQALSLHTIIIAGIALIVLVVLVGIFTGYFGKFTPSVLEAMERTCEPSNIKSECDPENEKELVGKFNPPLGSGQKCCKKIEDSQEVEEVKDVVDKEEEITSGGSGGGGLDECNRECDDDFPEDNFLYDQCLDVCAEKFD